MQSSPKTAEKYNQSHESSTSTNNTSSNNDVSDKSSSGYVNELEKTKSSHKHSTTPRQNLKAALIPHVKIHRNQHITDLYDLTEEKLGEGMTGAVVKATVKGSGQEVAVKNVRKNLVRDVKALLKEIALLAQCDHPNIVRIIGSAEDKHNVYMALEVCSGGALLDTLMNNSAHHFTEKEVGHMAVMMFRAIDYCHSHGIAHRDLKLDNWLFDGKGELKLIDFGLSKKFYSGDYDHHGVLRMTSFLGTPGFVAPEMQQTHFGERAEYTDLVDIWALGVIIFALLSGRMPFKRKPSDCVPLEDKEARAYRKSFHKAPWDTISESCKEFVESLLDPNPDTRLSAEKALKHPFLMKHAETLKTKRESMFVGQKSGRGSLKQRESIALTRMTEFARTDKLQKAAMLLIAHELHQDEIEELRTIFYRLDTDNDGEITWREMKAGFLELDSTPPEAVHELFEGFIESEKSTNYQDDQVIPYSYFLAATMDHHVLRNIDRLREAFHAYDPDDTGMVDLHKIMELLDDHTTKKHGSNVDLVKDHITQTREENKCEDTRHVTFDEFVNALNAFQDTTNEDWEEKLESHTDIVEKQNHRKKFISQKSSAVSAAASTEDASVKTIDSQNISAEMK